MSQRKIRNADIAEPIVPSNLSLPIFTTTISTLYDVVARITTVASTNGSYTLNATGMSITSSVTANSFCHIGISGTAVPSTTYPFDGNPQFNAGFNIPGPMATDGSIIICIGKPTVAGTGITFSGKQFGFKMLIASSVMTLYATQGDGTTETASTALTTLAVADSVEVAAVKNGTTSITYYWKVNTGSVSSVTLSTNIPAGLGSNGIFHSVGISNNNVAVAAKLNMSSFSYQR